MTHSKVLPVSAEQARILQLLGITPEAAVRLQLAELSAKLDAAKQSIKGAGQTRAHIARLLGLTEQQLLTAGRAPVLEGA